MVGFHCTILYSTKSAGNQCVYYPYITSIYSSLFLNAATTTETGIIPVAKYQDIYYNCHLFECTSYVLCLIQVATRDFPPHCFAPLPFVLPRFKLLKHPELTYTIFLHRPISSRELANVYLHSNRKETSW